jgi:hypothetical protein
VRSYLSSSVLVFDFVQPRSDSSRACRLEGVDTRVLVNRSVLKPYRSRFCHPCWLRGPELIKVRLHLFALLLTIRILYRRRQCLFRPGRNRCQTGRRFIVKPVCIGIDAHVVERSTYYHNRLLHDASCNIRDPMARDPAHLFVLLPADLSTPLA